MKRILFLFVPLTILLFLNSTISFSQNAPNKGVEEKNTISYYREIVGENSALYKGKVYEGVSKLIKGHQFFQTQEWQSGSLHYKGNDYQGVPMLYDILRDELVILHSNGFLKIQLLKEDLESFHFLNNTFVHIQDNDSANAVLSPGIYNRIHHGELSVLVKRRKLIEETIEEMEVKREFEKTNQYFIKKDSIYYPVKRKGSVLRVLKDRKKEVRKKLKAERIKFRKNPERAIVKMVEFYEQATN